MLEVNILKVSPNNLASIQRGVMLGQYKIADTESSINEINEIRAARQAHLDAARERRNQKPTHLAVIRVLTEQDNQTAPKLARALGLPLVVTRQYLQELRQRGVVRRVATEISNKPRTRGRPPHAWKAVGPRTVSF
jgi:predicted transcriptional regulator